MKVITQKVVYVAVLFIAIISNFAYGQTAITNDEAKISITSMGAIADTVFAGTASNGVYRSADGGKVWVPVNNGLPQEASVKGMATSGKNIFVLTFNNRYSLYLSSDKGMNWKEIQVCTACAGAYGTVGITSFKNKVFAATIDGLYESADDGANWNQVPAIIEKESNKLVASNDRIVLWSEKPDNKNIFYTSADGIKWDVISSEDVLIDKMEVHGNNFVITWCQWVENRGGDQSRCLSTRWRILSKNGKKWEPMIELRPREFAYDGDNIYAITVDVTVTKKNDVKYVRKVLMSNDRGKGWKAVDENTDPVVVSNYNIQEKLTELKAWEPTEIEEQKAMLRAQKLEAEAYAAARLKAQQAQRELDAQYNATHTNSGSSGSSSGYKQPDYRALSNDRFNEMHNSNSYIDSKGGMHIR